jgi:hypothetical protein
MSENNGVEAKDRRKFLGDATALISISLLPAEPLALQGSSASPEQAAAESLKGNPAWLDLANSIKVIEWNPVELRDGLEFSSTLSINGVESRSYVRRVDAGKTYSVFHYAVLPNEKTVVNIVNVTKSEQQGDYRLDTVQVTRIEPDGTVIRQQSTVGRVLTTRPYSGLSPQETIQRFLEDRAAGRE